MSAPRRVLWLTKGLGRGGAEQLLTTSARHVDPARFRVEVAYLLPHKDALVATLRRDGVAVHCLDQRSPLDLRWVGRLRRLVREHDVELVHTHMPLPAAGARLGLGGHGRRPALVHTEHNVWQRYRKATYWANALTYDRNDAVLAVSQAVADSIDPRRTGPRPVEVLHHGIDFDAMRRGPAARAEARALLGLAPEAFVVGTVANMTPKKDQDSLLRAFAVLRSRLPSAVLVLVGTGPLLEHLQGQARALGVGGSTRFLGLRDDVEVLLPAFDAFALSSLHEGLSIALVEAMASGVPAACTRVGGVPEVLTDGVDGLLVPPSDPAALGDALLRLADDPVLHSRLAAAGLDRARAFDIGRATLRIEDVYDEVLTTRVPA